jgi:hypothetical protein
MPNKRDGTPQKQNGGRPISAATEFTRMQAREMAASGNSPLDVIIDNMLFWDEDAKTLAEKLAAAFSSEEDQDRRLELLKSLEPLLNAREYAQRCALAAVRYVHPKLETSATDRPWAADCNP